MSQFTVTVKGAGLIDSTTEKNITQAATSVPLHGLKTSNSQT
jgi:hypothetical protein